MRLFVVTVSLILTLVSPAYARDCTLTDEQWIGHEYPRLKSWSSVYASIGLTHLSATTDGWLRATPRLS
jgi:hypothetical protein